MRAIPGFTADWPRTSAREGRWAARGRGKWIPDPGPATTEDHGFFEINGLVLGAPYIAYRLDLDRGPYSKANPYFIADAGQPVDVGIMRPEK